MTGRLSALAVIAVTMILWAHTASGQRPETITWNVDGQVRHAIVHEPAANSIGGKSPLVLSFHGHGDNMQNFQHTNLHDAWPEAIVVYFQGLPSRDGLSGWQVEQGQDGDRDLRLVDTALMSLRKQFKVDEARIYSTGFSNGAGFTYLLWAERPAVFAAFAPVAARLRPSVQPKQPRPVFHVAGTKDTTIPFADQQQAIETAKRVNGVSEQGASCGTGCTTYGSGVATIMTWLHPGGHQYPAGTSERIAKFFREHPSKP